MKRRLDYDWTFLAVMLVGVAAFGIFSTQLYWVQVASTVGIFAILGVSLNLLVGSAGQVSLGHAGFFGVGAYTTALMMKLVHVDFLVATLTAIAVTSLMGVVVGYSALRLRGHYLAMATLAFGLIVYGLLSELEITGGNKGLLGIPSAHLLSVDLSSPVAFFCFVWATAALVFAAVLSLQRSRVGRALHALRLDETAAESLGIRVARLKIQVFTFTSAIAGLAGACYSAYLSALIPASFGFDATLTILIIVVIGGLGRVPGTILGASITVALPELGRGYETFRLFGYAVLIVALVLLLPGGVDEIVRRIVQLVRRAWARMRRAPARADPGAPG